MKLNRHKGKVTKFTCGPAHTGMSLSLNTCMLESHCAHNMWNRVSVPIVTPSSYLLIYFPGCFWTSGCEIHQNDWARHPGGCFFTEQRKSEKYTSAYQQCLHSHKMQRSEQQSSTDTHDKFWWHLVSQQASVHYPSEETSLWLVLAFIFPLERLLFKVHISIA